MKYFLISEDQTMVQRPFILNWHEKIDVRNIHLTEALKLPPRELVIIRGNPVPVFTDIISVPFFLISEKVREVVKMYDPRTKMTELVLLDQENGKAERYFLPVFEEVDCIKEEYFPALNRGEMKKVILNRERIGERSMFRVAGVEKQYIIGNLDIVESLLKRGCTGMALAEICYTTDNCGNDSQ